MQKLLILVLIFKASLFANMPTEVTKPFETGIGWLTGGLFGLVMTIALIFTGYTWITGDQEKAKAWLKNILIGGSVVLLAGTVAALFG